MAIKQPQQQNPDLVVWNDRFVDLNQSLQALADNYAPSTLLNFSRKETLFNLVNCLQNFANDQFNFFYTGLNGRHKLVASDEFPIEFVLQAVIAQVTYDLEVILRAADQRISGTLQMKQTLDTADKLAWKALQPAKDYGWVPPKTTVLTYFQKSAAIRIIPYAHIALIGVPFTSVSIERDYLAIPHEVGHYVYRHGMVEVNREQKPIFRVLDQRLSGTSPELKAWTEEIFADVYGGLVGGPVTGLSAQDLAMQVSLKEFTDNIKDKTHPTPIVRPDIYTRILGMSSSKLADRWQSKRDGRPLPPIVIPRKALNNIIDKVVELLQPMASIEKWSTDVGAKADVETLYDKFKDFVAATKANGVPFEELQPCVAELWSEWVRREKFFGGELPPVAPAKILPGTEDDLKREPDGTWLHVALAGGWSTRIGNHGSP